MLNDSLAHQARALWSTPYSSQFAFPAWVADEWARIHQTFGPTAKIYHASDNLPEVRTLAVFREPTNIAMDRFGSRKTLDKFCKLHSRVTLEGFIVMGLI